MKKIILYILLLINISCSYSEKESDNSINIEEALNKIGEVKVSDIGEHITYVPLETTDQSLIGKRAYVRMLKDKLLIGSFQQPIKMFEKETGKFICTLGKIGQGANEYVLQEGIPIFWVDDERGMIYVQSEGRKILRFNEKGDFMDNLELPEFFPLMQAVSQVTINNQLFIYQKTLFKKPTNKIFMYDILNDKICNEITNNDESISMNLSQTPLIIPGSENIPVSPSCVIFSLNDGQLIFHHAKEPCLWTFGKNVYLKETFNDTIFSISKGRLDPRFIFNLGNRHLDYKNRYNAEGNEDKVVIDYVLEGKNTLFFAFQINYFNLKDSKTYLGVYNKKNNSVKVTNSDKIIDSVKNIFIGKLHTATSDGKFVGLMDATTFLGSNKNNPFNISEEDNPIVTIID